MRVYRYLAPLLMALLGLGVAPWALAASCEEVFPLDMKSNGVRLDLSFVTEKEGLEPFPSTSWTAPQDGDWFFTGGTLGNREVIKVPTGEGKTTRIYVQGDVVLGPHSSLNPDGAPENLILIVTGTVSIQADQQTPDTINALIYAVGDVSVGNGISVKGAITSQGQVNAHKQHSSVVYDADAVAKADFGSFLCGLPTVDHYRLSYSSQALTCQPHAIRVTACSNDRCDVYGDGPSSVTLAPGGIATSFTGTGTALVAVRTPGPLAGGLAIGSADPAPANATLCSVDGGPFSTDCPLTFAEAGLLLEAPDLIAGKEGELSITAVRQSDKSAACVPAFAGVEREVAFWSHYVEPGAGSRAVQLAGRALAFDEASATRWRLAFDAGGKARVALRYADAGMIQVEARYSGTAANGDEGLAMRGADQFVSRPYGLYLEADALAGCSAPGADCSPYAGGAVRAGDRFAMRARAKAWTVDEERTAANLRDNPDTPNYQQAGIALSHEVLAPLGGVAASASTYDHQPGEQTSLEHAIDEVGVFSVVATPPSYLGSDMGHALSRSAAVGRFVPAYLEVEGTTPQLADSCSDPASGLGFGYQGQPLDFAVAPAFAVGGRNRGGGITRNYDLGGFWRLTSGFVHDYRFGSNDHDPSGVPVHDNDRLSVSGSFTPEVSGDDDGDGERSYRLEGESLIYARSAGEPLASDAPFTPYLDLTLAADQLKDLDAVCYTAGDQTPGAPCQDFTLANFSFASAASQIRLGRVRLENVIAPDFAAAGASRPQAQLPLQIEHWGSSGYQAAADTCTEVEELPAQRSYSGNLSRVEVAPYAGGLVPVDAVDGAGGRLDGAATLSFDLKSLSGGVVLPASWLCLPSATDALASGGVCSSYGGGARGAASATFGIYHGSRPLIFRRELYR